MQKDNGCPFCISDEFVGINAFGIKGMLTTRVNFIIVYDEIEFIKKAMRKPFEVFGEGSEEPTDKNLNDKEKKNILQTFRFWKF